MSGARRTISLIDCLIVPLVAAAAASLLAILLLLPNPDSVAASHSPGGADNFLIDMDPTGNTATSIGTVELCARINENNILDADEDSVDSLNLDVVTGPAGIPTSHPMRLFQFGLYYPAGVAFVSNFDTDFLLYSDPDSSTPNFVGDGFPDNDGIFLGGSVDSANPGIASETGPGVLERVTMTTNAAAVPGIYDLTLGPDGKNAHVDDVGEGHESHNHVGMSLIPGAALAVGMPCPPNADVDLLDVSLTVPDTAPVGAPFSTSVSPLIHNQGPAALTSVDVVIHLDLPEFCITPDDTLTVQDVSIPVSSSVTAGPYEIPVTCFQTGLKVLSARVGISAADPALTNNIFDSLPDSITIGPSPGQFDPAVDGDKIYWTNRVQNVIQRSNLDGNDIEVVVDPEGASLHRDLIVDPTGGKIYFSSGDAIRRINLDGSGEEVILSVPNPRHFAIDDVNDKLYWTNISGVFRSNLDGSLVEQLAVGDANGVALDRGESMLYWTLRDGQVFRKSLAGGADQLLLAGAPFQIPEIAVDPPSGKLFLSQPTRIERANLDGSNLETIYTSPAANVGDVEVSAGRLFWHEDRKQIWTSTLSGGNPTLLVQTPPPTNLGFQHLNQIHVVASDGDGDGVKDLDETNCGSDQADPSSIPERVDGAFAGVDDDGNDGADEVLPGGATGFDCDGDGYTGDAEDHVYSYVPQLNGDQKTCQEYDANFTSVDPNQTAATPSLRWPSDFNNATFPLDSFNKITILDITSFLVPVKYFGTNLSTNPGDVRWDLTPGPGVFLTDINVQDITAMIAGPSGIPPMLGGAKAFGGPVCPWAP